MIIRSISIRSKFQLTTLFIVLFLVILALIYMDASKKSSLKQDLLNERSTLQSEYFLLNTTFNQILIDNESNMTAVCISQVRRVEEQIPM